LAEVTRRIGLSLGADICWPKCFEDIVRQMDLALPLGGDTVRFQVRRVTIEPFSLRRPAPYDLVVDRLTHWYHTSREWIKKAILMDGVYVFNNPWSVQSMEKHTTYCAMMRLGMPIPETWLIPPKEYEDKPDLQTTLSRYAEMFDLGNVGKGVGYPAFMKPYDGGGWVGVSRVDDEQALRDAYEKSGRSVMHVQKGIVPYDHFVRCVGIGPQTRAIDYDPSAPLHERYRKSRDFLPPADVEHLRMVTLTINAFFGWDFNSCEALSANGTWHPIDFANPCPDSQVTSLHVHFPWLVKAKIRWALFCAASRRKMRQNLDWAPFYAIAEEGAPYDERLRRWAKLADERFETARFEEFCDQHLGDLDEVAWEYFGSERAKEAVRAKVAALFPEHEHDSFTERFWACIQEWRDHDAATRAGSRS